MPPHNPTVHQIEGLYVDRQVTVGDLKGTVEFVFPCFTHCSARMHEKSVSRPHYFFLSTEPSFEN